jgi:hypothetical protein
VISRISKELSVCLSVFRPSSSRCTRHIQVSRCEARIWPTKNGIAPSVRWDLYSGLWCKMWQTDIDVRMGPGPSGSFTDPPTSTGPWWFVGNSEAKKWRSGVEFEFLRSTKTTAAQALINPTAPHKKKRRRLLRVTNQQTKGSVDGTHTRPVHAIHFPPSSCPRLNRTRSLFPCH